VEKSFDSHHNLLSPIALYRGKWNGQILYYWSSIYSSCALCDLYTETEGGEIKMIDAALKEQVAEESIDWELLFTTTDRAS
jgi:hypothetical protein